MFADNRRRWVMGPDGRYEQVQPDGDEPIRDTQSILMEQTRRATDGTTNQGVVMDDRFVDEDLLVDPSSEADNDTHPRSGDDSPDVLDAHSEHWYVPDSDQYAYTVRTPDGDRRYFETREGATELLEQLYE
jgi:polyphosphate kinase